MSGKGNGNKNAKGLADPSRLKSLEDDDGKIVNVIIETPKGSRNKYAFDQETRTYTLKKVLPAGMASPTTSVLFPLLWRTTVTPPTSWFSWMSPHFPAACCNAD